VSWIGFVVRLAVTSTVIWLTIDVHLLWANTLEDMMVQANFFRRISPCRQTQALVAETKHKVTFVVSGHFDVKLHLAASF